MAVLDGVAAVDQKGFTKNENCNWNRHNYNTICCAVQPLYLSTIYEYKVPEVGMQCPYQNVKYHSWLKLKKNTHCNCGIEKYVHYYVES